MGADRPTLVEMVTDPDVPPMPPHITSKQGKAFLSALLNRDPDWMDIIAASFKQSLGHAVPG